MKYPAGWYTPCVCDCGKPVFVATRHIKTQQSCGCLQGNFKHGSKRVNRSDPLYGVWSGMRSRCSNPNEHAYHRYGGRGIQVCEQWDDFAKFRDWSLAAGYAKGLQLDRIDNDGPYVPDNCRWATPAERSRNRSNNILITRMGETKTLKDWAAVCSLSYATVYARYVKLGWDIERALTQPSQRAVKAARLGEGGDASK